MNYNIEIIYVLDNGTELTNIDSINKHIHLFPSDIKDAVRPFVYNALHQEQEWNKSIIHVYQNGKIDIKNNILTDESFNQQITSH